MNRSEEYCACEVSTCDRRPIAERAANLLQPRLSRSSLAKEAQVGDGGEAVVDPSHQDVQRDYLQPLLRHIRIAANETVDVLDQFSVGAVGSGARRELHKPGFPESLKVVRRFDVFAEVLDGVLKMSCSSDG